MDSVISRPSLRDVLRSELRDEHDQTEAAFAPFDLKTRVGYVRFLRAHLISVSSLASTLPGVNAYGLDFSVLEADLRRDLSCLGAEFCEARLPVSALKADVGVTYVMCGSHFGSAVLRRQVKDAVDLPDVGCYRYLESLHLKECWKKLLPDLTQDYFRQENLAVIRSSQETFLLFRRAADRVAGTND